MRAVCVICCDPVCLSHVCSTLSSISTVIEFNAALRLIPAKRVRSPAPLRHLRTLSPPPPSLLPRPPHLPSQSPTAPPPGTIPPDLARATTSATAHDHHTRATKAVPPPPPTPYSGLSDAPTDEHRVPHKSRTSTRTAISREPPASTAAVHSCATPRARPWLARCR